MKRYRLVLLAALLLAPACNSGSGGIGAVSCGFGLESSAHPEIELVVPEGNQSGAIIQVRDLTRSDLAALRGNPPTSDDWQALLRITVAPDGDTWQADPANQPAVAGAYSVTSNAIVFTPMFGLDPGRRYRAELNRAKLPSLRDAMTTPHDLIDMKEVWLPKPEAHPTTIVDHMYPSADEVPENQLRLYIHFSAPMGLRGGLDYISLLDDRGRTVKDPFLPLDAEFWNGDRTRFTVFFDPGRVKRGILPNKEMGRSLTEGRSYTLVVSREWRDGQGLPLKAEFRRVFRVRAPDEQPLDQRTWRIEPPRSGTRDPLAVTFREPLDHGLLARALGVMMADGRAVDGETRVDSRETRWTFVPRAPWAAGEHRLRVLAILEDLAGNRIGRAFEVDQFERADRQPEPEEIALPFSIR